MKNKKKYLLMSILFFFLGCIFQTIKMFYNLKGENSIIIQISVIASIILYVIYFILFLINIKNKND